jgi:predicted RNA-binding protein (virulence factor B family)
MPKVHWKMAAKTAGVIAMLNKESVAGVEQRVGAVNKVGLEMDVMVPLEDLVVVVINAYLNQVCTSFYCQNNFRL